MTQLVWDQIGSRRYETGADRGVLYPNNGPGVAWNGLVVVTEAPTGAAPVPQYLDGVKYQNRPAREEFGANLEAYTYPDEFEQCHGVTYIGNGLTLKQQKQIPFSLSYRTRVGNDVDGDLHGYKIHIIYNALAAPQPKKRSTITADPDAITFQWNLTAKPVNTPGYRPVYHMVVDSTKSTPQLMATVESILYGSPTTAARIPTPAELMTLFTGWPTLFVTTNSDGSFTITGPDDVVKIIDPSTYQVISSTATDNGNGSFTVGSY